jgi:hypothetical protein
MMITNGNARKRPATGLLSALDERGSKRAKVASSAVAVVPRKNDTGSAKAAARLAALEEFADGLKGNKMALKRGVRVDDARKRQKEARAAIVDSNRKKNTAPVPTAKRKVAEKAPMPAAKQRKKAAEKVAEEEVKEAQKGDLDLSDLTFEQVEALKEFGGLTGNLTREQIDEIISRVSPLTEGGRPFVISTPMPTARFLPARRLKVNDIATGRKIVL